MLLITLSHVAALTLTLAALAWYRPQALRSIGNGLIRLCDAMQTARAVFQGTAPTVAPRLKKGFSTVTWEPKPAASLTPIQSDVLQALIAQGATRGRAKSSVDRAIAALPPSATFDDLFRKAVTA
jgi:hypothetical protein